MLLQHGGSDATASFEEQEHSLAARDKREDFYVGDIVRREGGTGLGLAVVERVIRQHSGAISLNSTLGKGSRVLVRLPVDPRTGR